MPGPPAFAFPGAFVANADKSTPISLISTVAASGHRIEPITNRRKKGACVPQSLGSEYDRKNYHILLKVLQPITDS